VVGARPAGVCTERYGSLETPTFHWVLDEYKRDPYEAVRRNLGSKFELVDVTDLNSDVSFAYDLRSKHSLEAWTLRLSMVGPYATVIRHEGPPAEAILDGAGGARTDEERAVVDACQTAGCDVLSRQILGSPVALRLFDTSPERVRFYQALFSDVDFLPGEYEQDRQT
jgi:hypothetical protein